MDADRFDQWTHVIAGIVSRRGLLGVTGAGLSGLAAFAAGAEFDVEARKKRRKKKRKKGKKRKKCKGGKTKCSGKCRDLSSNDNNCGSCGNECDPDEECQNGFCQGNGCQPDCQAAKCGDSDGCGGICDGACPPGADVTCNVGTGTCNCNNQGNCCFDTDCDQLGPNFVCLSVNNLNNCFCDPDLLCGPVCCPVGTQCQNPQVGACVGEG